MDPKEIGERQPPAQMDAEDEYLKDTDQRWFSQLSEAQESGDLADPEGVWTGEGYMIDEIRRIAAEHPETRRHLVPLIKKYGRAGR